MRREVNRCVEIRNEIVSRQEHRVRLRNRGGEREIRLIRETEEARRGVKRARSMLKTRLRLWEREWWEEKIRDCEEASRRGKIGEMYRVLRNLGTRGWKAPASTTVTNREFK